MTMPQSPSPSSSPQLSKTQSLPWSYKATLLGLIAILLLLLGKHMLPYMSGVLGALTLYILMRRQMKVLVEKRKWPPSWSATLIIVEVLFLFLLPLTGLVFMVIDVLSSSQLDIVQLSNDIQARINEIEREYGIQLFDFLDGKTMEEISRMGTSLLQSLASNTYSIIANSFVILFLLFFMLKGYRSFEQAIKELLPFNERNKKIIGLETNRIVISNAIGIPLLAVIQGVFAYIGYIIFGVEGALYYGVLTAMSTIIPLVGTMIVWIPLSIVFMAQGNWVAGVGLFLYGFIIIGGVDNIARFILQKKMADTHPIITVFGVIIGITLFGFWGIIFGPLMLSLLVLLINIYRYDYIPGSEARPGQRFPSEKKKFSIPGFVKRSQKTQGHSIFSGGGKE